MREKTIKHGVVYGVAGRYEKKPVATVLLEPRPRSMYIRDNGRIEKDPDQGGRTSAGHYLGARERGYAAVTGPADLLATVDCDCELQRLAEGQGPSDRRMTWTLVTQASKVLGPYQETARAYEQEQALLIGAAQARKAQVDSAISLLTAHGIGPVNPGYHNATVTLPAGRIESLLTDGAAPDGPGEDTAQRRCFYCEEDILIAGDGRWKVPGADGDDDEAACLDSPDGWHTPNMIHEDGSTIQEIERHELETAALDPRTLAALDRIAGAPLAADDTADAMKALYDRILAAVPEPERDRAEQHLCDLLHLSADDLSDEARTETVRTALALPAAVPPRAGNRALRKPSSPSGRGTAPGSGAVPRR